MVAPRSGSSVRAIAVMLLAMFLFACLDATNKLLSQSYSVVQVIWVRYLFMLVFAVALAYRHRKLRDIFLSRVVGRQILRGVALAAEIGFFVTALSLLPIADVHALGAISPLLATALAVPILGERVGWRRWAAITSGFVGVLIILRPGFAVIDWPLALPLIGAFFFALYQVLLRDVARFDSPETTLVYSGLTGAVLFSLIGPFNWRDPDAVGWMLLTASGVLGGIAHFTLTKAMDLGEASRLQPYGYTLMIWAAVLGLVVFGQFPDGWTILGGAVIAASGLYAFARERRRVTGV